MRSVAIFGCPRSGTSWLGQIFNSAPGVAYRYQPLFSHEFKNWFDRSPIDRPGVDAFHAAIAAASSGFVLQDLKPEKTGSPTHLVWKEVRHHGLIEPLIASDALDDVVYLYRRPVDVLNSWYQAPKEFRAGQDIDAEWRHAPSKNTDPTEWNGFERWKESLALACRLARTSPGRLRLLSYERLQRNPQATIDRLFPDLGLAVAPAVRAFIEASTSRHDADAYGVFRNAPAPRALPAHIVQEIESDSTARALLQEADALSA